MPHVHPSAPRIAVLALLLAWVSPRARGEGSLSYKYEDYRESGGRVGVRTQGAFLEQSLGADSKVKVMGILDAIAGATPTGVPAPAGSDEVPLASMHDRRKAWNASVSHRFSAVNVDLGIGNSRERDYVSNGWSLNTVTEFNRKNTQLLAGIAGTEDKVAVFYEFDAPRQRKRTNDAIIGLTQLLGPRTSVSLNLGWGRQRGYLADPYKVVQKTVEVFPGVFLRETFGENRPGKREKWILLAGINHDLPRLRGAFEGSYRFYHDSFGTDAHTVQLAWFQRLGAHVVLRPSVRWYTQSAADFYRYNLDDTPIVPTPGGQRPEGPFYSSDYRLTALRSLRYGLKVVWNATDALHFDAALERYEMRGRDGGTPASAFPSANIVSGGVSFSW